MTPALPLQIEGLRFAYNGHQVLGGIDLSIRGGEFVALMGRNGAGKTTLLKQCIGLLKPDAGRVLVMGQDTQRVPVERIARCVGYVPQNPNALLFADTLGQELAFTQRAQGMPVGDAAALLRAVGLEGMRDCYPRDLSAGERQRAALAAVLVSDPQLILLDEPTRGLDYAQKESLIAFLQAQQRAGVTVLVVTHDVELVAQCAQRVILLGDGEIVLDGPVGEVMTGSQLFASQVNKLFRDPRYLTVHDVVGDGGRGGCAGAEGGGSAGGERGGKRGGKRGAEEGAEEGGSAGAERGGSAGAEEGAEEGGSAGAERGAKRGGSAGAERGAKRGGSRTAPTGDGGGR